MILVFLLTLTAQSKLISVVEVCRHGARAPLSRLAWDKTEWLSGYGQLTPMGMRQQYLNGIQFRKKYIESAKLLSSQYNPQEIYVRSTDFNRTIMTAESQLMGLYPEGPKLSSLKMQSKAVPPIAGVDFSKKVKEVGSYALPNAFQAVPVHVVAVKYDRTLTGYSHAACPQMAAIASRVEKSDSYKSLALNYTNTLQKQLEAILGVTIPFEDVTFTADALFSSKFHGKALPEGLTSEIFNNLQEILSYFNYYFFQLNGAHLATSSFYSSLLNTFHSAINGTSPLKFSLYSAHDTTLIGLLTAIENYKGENPPFASSLIYELNDDEGNIRVRTVLNDELLRVPGCLELNCEFSQFEAFFKEWIIEDLDEACELKENDSRSLIFENLIFNRLG